MHVLLLGLGNLGVAVHPAPAAHDALDVVRGAGAPDGQQPRLGLGRGHPRERPDLGVRELALRQCVRQKRQRPESARDPDPFTGGAHVEPDAPVQPVGARAESIVPAALQIELADEIEQVAGRGLQVDRELGNLVAELIE